MVRFRTLRKLEFPNSNIFNFDLGKSKSPKVKIPFLFYLCSLKNYAEMSTKIIDIISQNLGIKENQVSNTISLLNEGATVPFISRYRKERTGSLT